MLSSVTDYMAIERKSRETEPKLNHFSVKLVGWNPESIGGLHLTELTEWVKLAHEVGSILSSFPTNTLPKIAYTELILLFDQQPAIIHHACVAYKYHATGGMNTIGIQEGEEVEGKRQIELSFDGHTTGFKKVAVTTERKDLREALKELISIGREAGGESELKMHGVNHPTTIYYPDFLPQQSDQ